MNPSLANRLTIASGLTLLVACGVKTLPRPPEDTAARPPTAVRAETVTDGVRIRWKRPDHSVDGQRLDDLVGFIIERDTGSEAFRPLVTIPVEELGRLRPQREYEYTDRGKPAAGTRYRVRALAADGQWGQPCPPVVVSPSRHTEGKAPPSEEGTTAP